MNDEALTARIIAAALIVFSIAVVTTSIGKNDAILTFLGVSVSTAAIITLSGFLFIYDVFAHVRLNFSANFPAQVLLAFGGGFSLSGFMIILISYDLKYIIPVIASVLFTILLMWWAKHYRK